jgi:hypothetical protein
VFFIKSVLFSIKVLQNSKKGHIAMTEKRKETVGKLSSELLQRDTYADHSAGEQMQAQLSDYESNLFDRVVHGKTVYPSDFYLVVIAKREKLMPNAFRLYYFHRISCPSPDYDQTVYKYHRKDDALEFLWVVPAKPVIQEMIAHKHELDPSLFQLLKFVIEFVDGTLDKKARELNGEPLVTIAPIV